MITRALGGLSGLVAIFAATVLAQQPASPPAFRFERPVVTTIWSASEDFPAISMATVCSALASSRLCSTTSIILSSGVGVGSAAGAAFFLDDAAISKWPSPMQVHESCGYQHSL